MCFSMGRLAETRSGAKMEHGEMDRVGFVLQSGFTGLGRCEDIVPACRYRGKSRMTCLRITGIGEQDYIHFF